MTRQVNAYGKLLKTIRDRERRVDGFFLIGIGGPPASGKPTLAICLAEDLDHAGLDACYCPMDGFHLTNSRLALDGTRDAKGSIRTFDAEAYCAAVSHLKVRQAFWWPRNSRDLHDPIPEETGLRVRRRCASSSATTFSWIPTHGSCRPWRSSCAYLSMSSMVSCENVCLIVTWRVAGHVMLHLGTSTMSTCQMPGRSGSRRPGSRSITRVHAEQCADGSSGHGA